MRRPAYDVLTGAGVGLGVGAVSAVATFAVEPFGVVLVATLFTWLWTLLVLLFAILLPFVGESAREKRIGLGLWTAIVPLVLSSLFSFGYLAAGG